MKEILWQNFMQKEGQFTELGKLAFVAMVTPLSRQETFYKSCFDHCICEPSLTFMAFMLLELFSIMLSKYRRSTLEPRLQIKHRETWVRAIYVT